MIQLHRTAGKVGKGLDVLVHQRRTGQGTRAILSLDLHRSFLFLLSWVVTGVPSGLLDVKKQKRTSEVVSLKEENSRTSSQGFLTDLETVQEKLNLQDGAVQQEDIRVLRSRCVCKRILWCHFASLRNTYGTFTQPGTCALKCCRWSVSAICDSFIPALTNYSHLTLRAISCCANAFKKHLAPKRFLTSHSPVLRH